MTAAVSFTVEGATVQINLPPGTTIADVDKRRLAKLVDAKSREVRKALETKVTEPKTQANVSNVSSVREVCQNKDTPMPANNIRDSGSVAMKA